MENKENLSISCDIETGICSPNKPTNQSQAMNLEEGKTANAKLTYYFDALCGWCYGFSPVMSKINETFGDKLEIEVISGGLFLGNRAGGVNEVAPHIKAGAYKSVEARTGVKFGKPFLDDVFGEGKMTLNSLPTSIALCIVKEQFPEKELEFAEMLLHAVYYDGMNPINIEEYAEYVEKIGLDQKDFLAKMKEDRYRTLAIKEFEKFSSSRFSGMPALVLETEEGEIPLSSDYTSFEHLKPLLEQHIKSR